MPILRVARAHARIARATAAQRTYSRDSNPILGFWDRGSKVPQNGRFPALDADEPPTKI